MFSKNDIIKELGNGICIVPFREDCIKANALNLTASEYAWTLKSGEIWIDDNGNVSASDLGANSTKYQLNDKKSALIEHNGQKQIVFLPYSTTLIETNEVLSIGPNIGGEYHSKVYFVSKGTCHIGTYLEPNYNGHSLIAIHYMNDEPLLLKVNEVIASITFFYLDTPVLTTTHAATGGRSDIITTTGILLSDEEKFSLFAPWKQDKNEIKQKMMDDPTYISFKKRRAKHVIDDIRRFINWQNFMVLLLIIGILVGLFNGAHYIDVKNGNTIWVDRFWNVGCSGIVIMLVGGLSKFFKK
ncbi:hypothetical protein ABE547_03430 [Dorea sp. YH-dor226]|uniref:dCTP deaminase domain-containing protein n=1 Tax=Dorea sp. YH-dor226 TaxID=3151119 RepID=UPI003242AE34